MTALDATAPPPSVPIVPQAPAPEAPSAPEAARAPGTGMVRFLGREQAYWRLMIRGALLLAVTLGIYRFWLATDQRRFLWGNTEIAGDTLEYTGTARELLIGFLIALAVLVPLNTAFFLAALDAGITTVVTFLLLALFGHFAIYRARRYRLTRTVFRGVRLHQTGSAWFYAVVSMLWWVAIIATFGLAYPWAQAMLERYKMHHTHYGDLRGRFVGSGTRLFFQGLIMWLLVMGPLLVAFVVTVAAIDWNAFGAALRAEGPAALGRVENHSPNFAGAITFMVMATLWSGLAAAVLYPVFQAMVLRWWVSGLRFGEIRATSHLRTGQMYGVYLSFVGYVFVYSIAAGLVVGILTTAATLLFKASIGNQAGEIGGVVVGAFGYVVMMLGYSTIYQVIVRQRMWRLSFETAELAGLHELDKVKARGAASSAFGEGLADALDVGGL
jgi:uncharacterized membrane protein YjgN (DUF898 family)